MTTRATGLSTSYSKQCKIELLNTEHIYNSMSIGHCAGRYRLTVARGNVSYLS